MDLNDFETRLELLDQFIIEFIDSEYEDIAEFFHINNLGIPFVIGLANEYITLTEKGKGIVNETFEDLCDFVGADKNEYYEDYDDFIKDIENHI